MIMTEVRVAPPYLPLNHAASSYIPLPQHPTTSQLILFYICYAAVVRYGRWVHWTLLFILWYGRKQIKERSRLAAGSNSFYFLEPHHHVGRLKCEYPPSGSAVLKQHDLKKYRNEWKLRKEKGQALAADSVICCLPHLVMTLQQSSNTEMRSVATIKVNDTVLWD